jgi:hypothetical protein
MVKVKKKFDFNFLFSFAYLSPDVAVNSSAKALKKFNELSMVMANNTCVLIDSGAYTAYTRRRVIDLKKYIKECRRYERENVWNYIQLDKVKDHQVSTRNLNRMLDAGLKPMPVLTMDMSLNRADPLSKICDGWVCVAGGVGTPDKWAWRRYQETFRISNKKAKIHALGFMRHPDLFRLPLASVDASTWCTGQKFGILKVYHKRDGLIQCMSRDFRTLGSKKADPRILQYFARCGIGSDKIIDGSFNHGHRAFVTQATIHSYLQFAKHCHERGMKMFFVLTDVMDLLALLCVDEANRGSWFDHKLAVNVKNNLQKMVKDDWNGFLDVVVKFMRRGMQ